MTTLGEGTQCPDDVKRPFAERPVIVRRAVVVAQPRVGNARWKRIENHSGLRRLQQVQVANVDAQVEIRRRKLVEQAAQLVEAGR